MYDVQRGLLQCRVCNVGSGMWAVQCGVCNVQCATWSVECGVWSVGRGTCSAFRSAWAGGALEVILRRLSEFMERASSLRRKVKGAMVYPIVVVSVAVGILSFIMITIVPLRGCFCF